jgi:hypothetical protein
MSKYKSAARVEPYSTAMSAKTTRKTIAIRFNRMETSVNSGDPGVWQSKLCGNQNCVAIKSERQHCIVGNTRKAKPWFQQKGTADFPLNHSLWDQQT